MAKNREVVIIPYANNPTDLSVLLVQLQQQTRLPEAIYLADNSLDGVGQLLARRYHWSVPIYVERNVGTIYQSWNAGLEFADGRDAIIINDDVMINQDFIANMAMFRNKAMVVCPSNSGFPPVTYIRDDYEWEKLYSVSEAEFYGVRTVNKPNGIYHPSLTGWCFMLPSSTYQSIGKFDEQFEIWYGDTDYDRRIHNYANKVRRPGVAFIPTFVQHFGTTSFAKIDKSVFLSKNLSDQVKFERKYKLVHKDLGWG